MSRINEIEKKLSQIGQAEFQKLIEKYMHFKGYNVSPIGSVIGENKTRKGRPDILISKQGGKYSFAECTVTKNSKSSKKVLLNKLKQDIKDILDEIKNKKVSKTEVESIILCFNSADVSITEKKEIQKIAGKYKVEYWHLNFIAFEIDKYPPITKDFLGISHDTNQIQDIKSFIDENERRSITTSHLTVFSQRDEEVNQIIQCLQENDIILISGEAGVGKTRIAIEAINKFYSTNKSVVKYVISSKFDMDISNDLNYYYLRNQNYVTVIDDANRLNANANFDKILYRLYSSVDIKNKTVITVRSYAISKVKNSLKQLDVKFTEVQLGNFSDEKIELIIKDNYSFNKKAINRILELANGNIRIGLMAARVAKQTNNIQELYNTASLFDSFYKDKFSTVINKNLLKSLTIISIFRNIDNERKPNDLDKLLSVFEIDEKQLWNDFTELHNLELIDVFQDKSSVKISEQNLMPFAFYKTFFDLKIVSFRKLLFDFYSSNNTYAFKEIFYATIRNFNDQDIFKYIKPDVDDYLSSIIKNNEEYVNALHIFWFLNPEKVLDFVWNRVKALPVISDTSKYKFETTNNYLKIDSNIDLLSHFIDDRNTIFFKNGVEILLEYIQRDSECFPMYLKYINDHLGIEYENFQTGFNSEKIFISTLINKSELKNLLYLKLFFFIAHNYLNTEFRNFNSGRRGRTINMISFKLEIENSELIQLRKLIWDAAFKNFKRLPDDGLRFLNNYIQNSGFGESRTKFYYENDYPFVLKLINKCLSPSNYFHCVFVNTYFLKLKKFQKIEKTEYLELKNKFSNSTYKYSKFIVTNHLDSTFLFHDYRIYGDEELKRTNLYKKVKSITPSDYCKIIECYNLINKDSNTIVDVTDNNLAYISIALIDVNKTKQI